MIDFEKHIHLGGYGDGWGPGMTLIHSSVMEKTASECHTPEKLLRTIEGLRERPEGVYVLLNALGAYEYWGVNRNGDAFPEWSLKSLPPPREVLSYIDSKVRSKIPGFMVPPPSRYGSCTFETDAHVFPLHQNKDPMRSVGDVVASAYNEHMHRVELIVFVYEARAPEAVRRIRAGDQVPFSMGAKLPFDVCSICFNAAKNRSQYCEHLRDSTNRIFPDGRKVFMYNWFPRFFDISIVRIPADRSAWSLRKVAGAGGEAEFVAHEPKLIVGPDTELSKVASVLGGEKVGEMVKKVPAEDAESVGSKPIDGRLLSFVRDQVRRDQSESPDIEDPQMDEALRREGLGKVLAALALAGIVLKPGELRRARAVSGDDVPERLDLPRTPARLITIVRVLAPRRSLVDPEFSERRKARLAKSAGLAGTGDVHFDAEYRRYLDLLVKEAEGIVGEASSARVRVTLDPWWAGKALFKSGASKEPEAWMPFLSAVTEHRESGTSLPCR